MKLFKSRIEREFERSCERIDVEGYTRAPEYLSRGQPIGGYADVVYQLVREGMEGISDGADGQDSGIAALAKAALKITSLRTYLEKQETRDAPAIRAARSVEDAIRHYVLHQTRGSGMLLEVEARALRDELNRNGESS